MSFLSLLDGGGLGVMLSLPDRLELLKDEDSAALFDPVTSAEWHFLFARGLHLDLAAEGRDELRAALEWPARAMFNDVHRKTAEPDIEPRTADSAWSPMIEAEFVSLPNQDALRTVHRMVYRPGSEVIMGHLLVPVCDGLFEARVVTRNSGPTGLRESILLMERDGNTPGADGETDFPGQGYYDNPERDERFPDHPLSRLRAAQRMFMSDWGLGVSAPAEPMTVDRVRLQSPECSFVPPPRFHEGRDGIQRATFCATDGIQSLIVSRLEDEADVEAAGVAHATELHVSEGVENIELRASVAPLGDGQSVTVSVEGDGHLGRLQNTLVYFCAAGSLWNVAITGTLGFPDGGLQAELAGVARSFEAPKKKRWFGLF